MEIQIQVEFQRPEFTSRREERVKILVNSCIRWVDRIGMRVSRESCAARPREGMKHAVSKFRRAVIMEITVEDSKRCNIAAECKRLKTVSKRMGVSKTKSF